jgi:exopolysaccharide production protein ExoZ
MVAHSRLLGVQYVRAVAALMVVYVHVIDQMPAYTEYLRIHTIIETHNFNFGVQLFFVVSGFVMYLTGIDSKLTDFAVRRLCRIVPLYWALTLLICALGVTLPSLFRHTQVTGAHVLESLFFIPYIDPARASLDPPEPLLGPGWSLNYEMAFYLLLALALLLPRRLRLPSMCAVLLALVAIGLTHPHNFYVAFYTRAELELFGIGLVIGWLYRRATLQLLPLWASAGLILTGFALLLGSWPIDPVDKLVGPIPIILGVCALDSRREMPNVPLLALLGDASYSIYLTHIFTLGALRAVWPHLGMRGVHGAISFAIVGICVSACVGIVSYRLFERPTLAALSTWFIPARPRGALADASATP